MPDNDPSTVSHAFLERLNTAPLQRGAQPTRALVVVQPDNIPGARVATARFSFPVRAATGPQPITVRDADGTAIPSRIAAEQLGPVVGGKRIWEFTLQIRTENLPPLGWRTYAATYERNLDAPAWPAEEPAATPLDLYETECHDGDLPATLSLLRANGDARVAVQIVSLGGETCSVLVRNLSQRSATVDLRFALPMRAVEAAPENASPDARALLPLRDNGTRTVVEALPPLGAVLLTLHLPPPSKSNAV